jgi:RHS repeat-associated protein
MNRKMNVANIILSALIGLTLILSALNPTAAYASAPAVKPTRTPPPTLTATPTATPIPVTATPAPVSTEPALSLSSDPTYITPGGQVTIIYQITNFEKFTDSTMLEFHAPVGLFPADTSLGKFDETSGTFYLQVKEAEGKILWQADEKIAPPVTVTAELLQDGQAIAKAEVTLDELTEFPVDSKGGKATGMEGKVQVTFPDGAVSETVKVKVTSPSAESLPVQSLSGAPFEITAISENTKAEVSRFSKPVEIQVDYSGSALTGSEEDLVLYWYDPTDGQWKLPLSQHVDTENKLIIATTDHFTVFDMYNSNWQSAVTPTLSSFQTSSFTGASSFSMPIELPAGPGGFQPSLTLSYSSSVVDNSSSESQASWVGMGWSLTTSYIERNGHGTNAINDDSFELNLNGMSVELLPGIDGKYHASDENFYKVEFNAPTNEDASTWTIWDKSGNQYFFEWRTQMVAPNNCGQGFQMNKYVWRWSLTRVVNIYDQLVTPTRAITYSYAPDTRTIQYTNCYQQQENMTAAIWVYPSEIRYANNRYRVVFERTGRTDYKTVWTSINTLYHSFQRYLLDTVRVEQDANGDGTFETLIRKYKFNYCNNQSCSIFPDLVWDAGGRTPTLTSVQEFGLGGTQSLPASTFTYGDGMHLTSASNGYGGTITYQYDDFNYDGISEGAWHDTIPAGSTGGNPVLYEKTAGWAARSGIPNACLLNGALRVFCEVKNSNINAIMPGRYYTVLADVEADRIDAYHPWGTWVKIGLAYKVGGVWQADQYSQQIALPLDLVPGSFPPRYTPRRISITLDPRLVPYNATEVKALIDSDGVRMVSYRLIPVVTASRVSAQTVSAGSDALTTKYLYEGASTNTIAISEAASGPHPYIKPNTEFRGHQFVTVIDPYGGRTRTEFKQDDCLAGSPIAMTVKNSAGTALQSSTSSYDCSEWTSDLHLIDKDTRDPALYNTEFDRLKYYWARTMGDTRTVFENDGTTEAGSLTTSYEYESTYGNLVSQSVSGSGVPNLTTHFEYYLNLNGGKHMVGLPSHTWVENGTGTLAETINVFDGNGILTKTRTLMRPGDYSQATIGYDEWGNVTSLTAYSGYGTSAADPTTGARTASTVYDSAYHTYPISVTTPPTDLFPAGLTTTLTYDYALGAPTREVGPNGLATKADAEYDVFGRLTKLIHPGDDSASPTLQIQYTGTNPFTVTLTQKIQNGQFYTATRTYDGLGRPTSASAGGSSVIYQYGYENGARVDRQSTPFAGSEQYFFTTTTYDNFGRPATVTAPGDLVTSFAYNGLESTVTDAKGNKNTTATDMLGRTLSVTPKDEYGNAFGPNVVFTYDDLGNLKTATRGGAVTTMNYDLAGRKTSMSDPDMGSWQYQYDALNNLTTQTDARGCVTTMDYDNLNRPTNKSYSDCPSSVSATASVTYGYDSGLYGAGHPTSMSDGSNSSAWEYDEHGRLKKETKIITNNSPLVTEWDYNSADAPKWMKYPDGETVNFYYDSRMLLNSVIGADTYINSSGYDSAGRLTTRTLGNGLTQTYHYYNWDEKVNNVGQGGRLETLTTGSLQNLGYQYDAVGNVKQIVNSLANETSTYGYDALNRLTSWTLNGQTESYGYNDTTGNLSTKNQLALDYPTNGTIPHAVTRATINGNTNTYGYDANGNQTTRSVVMPDGTKNYTLGYDAENRLVSVTGPSLNAQFVYDGNGQRVKSVINGETILFVGGYFEKKGNEITKYYPGGAMRKYVIPQSMNVEYTLGDQLGSASVMTDSAGNKVSEMRYNPWGQVRYSWVDPNLSTTPAYTLPKHTFTGQYSYMDDPSTSGVTEGFGLMFYNARWYDPTTGRFAQADTVVLGGVQGFDRYAYVGNNPVNYTDPSGHIRQRHSPKECEWDHSSWCSTILQKKMSEIVPDWDKLKALGYSDEEIQWLRTLFENGGPLAQHGVHYILDHGIHISIGTGWQSAGGSVGAWFDEGSNTIVINSEVPGNFIGDFHDKKLSLWGLSLIIHEARHLEQGPYLSHSITGEMDAWQTQIDVLMYLGYFPRDGNGKIILDKWAQDVMDARTPEAFAVAIYNNDPGYWNHGNGSVCIGLCSYPMDPADICMSLGPCAPLLPWWMYLNFTPYIPVVIR